MSSGSSQHLCPASALSGLLGEDGTRARAAVHTHTEGVVPLISWWISAVTLPMILLASQLFSPCVLFHGLLVTSASCLYYCHFLFQLLPLLWFLGELPTALSFLHWKLGITCFSSLLFFFPAQSQLSVNDAVFLADVSLFHLAVNSLILPHMGTKDMEIIHF